jgi:hypothetical protein
MNQSGPHLVSELIWYAKHDWKGLPPQVVALYELGRIVFQDKAMSLVASSGGIFILSGKDLLFFREGEPYVLAHLN